ncbi:sensor histidine kinase [Undibacterium danionis]|uniref:histidine kinase n=1 Tax=Undibacterium danionis TaxID=1812100 RepID=A0ABV6ICS0_9BURK
MPILTAFTAFISTLLIGWSQSAVATDASATAGPTVMSTVTVATSSQLRQPSGEIGRSSGNLPNPLLSNRDFSYTQYYFERIGNEDSLPMNIVTALAQDASGLIWIGTQGGLVRYDGYRFEKFVHNPRNPDSISGDYIKSLWAAPDGKVWIGGLSSGISIFDPHTGKFAPLRYGADGAQSIDLGAIQSIQGDRRGGVWIVGSDQGLLYLSPDRKQATSYRHRADDPQSLLDDKVRSIYLDQQETLWIGTTNGVQKLKKGRTQFELIATDIKHNDSLIGHEIRSIFQAQDGKIWLGFAKNGAAWIDPATSQLHRVKLDNLGLNSLGDNVIDIITQVRPEEIWLSRYGYGIYILDASSGELVHRIRNDAAVPGSLAFDQIGAMLFDRSGMLWVGSWGGGLQRYSKHQEAVRMLRHSPNRSTGLSHANVRSLLETRDGKILIGSDGNGIDIFDRKLGLIGGYRSDNEHPDKTIASAVLALSQTADQSIWAGTRQSGLQKLSLGKKDWQTYSMEHGLPSNQIRSLFTSKHDALWVGTTQGAALWNVEQKKFIRFTEFSGAAMNSYVTSFAEDQQGRIWIGSESGLWLHLPGSQHLQQILHDPMSPDSLSSNEVNGLLVDHQGQLWVDTAQGFDRLQSWDGKLAKFEHISDQLGHPGLYFGANLLEDKLGRIWTQWFVYHPKTKQLHDLSKSNGVDIGTAWVGSYLRTRDGLFLYGGTQGVALIQPELFHSWSYQPPVIATGLKINGIDQPMNLLQIELQLQPEQRHFEIEVAALDYLSPQKNRYAYRLLGYQNEWIETDASHRNISYGNLWPGSYTLQVKGSNRQGDWSPLELSVPIKVFPAFWQTSWFITLCTLLIGSLIYTLYRWRLARVKEEKRNLQKLVSARTEDILQLAEAGQGLTASLDTEQTFAKIRQQVSARLDAHVFGIAFCENSDQPDALIELDYLVEDGIRQPPIRYTLHESHTPAVWCVNQKRELITANREELLQFIGSIPPLKYGQPMESIIYLPLFVEGKVIGCMTVQSPRQQAYSQDQLEFLRALASYVAIAVANSQSHRHLLDAQRQLAQQEKMASLGQLVANVAHEINTPIGAIKSSGNNISTALDVAMHELADLMATLDQQARALFLDLIAQVKTPQHLFNTREERQLIANTTETLNQLGLSDTRRTAKVLVQLRAQQRIPEFLPLLQHQEANRILQAASAIAAIVHSAENIQVAVDRVAKIVFAFKSFSRIGNHNEKILANLRDGMDTVLTLYQNKINQGTELICQFDDIPELRCWPDELVQVWVNLIHNALQAMNYQGRLTIRIQKIDNNAVVSVSDTGEGIPEAIRSKIFDVFFTTKPVGEGSGLGLDIVRKIINKHRGTISFESEIGKGTTFIVSLPYEA